MLKNYSYLNPGLKIVFNGQVFVSENGLKDLLQDEIDGEILYPIIHLKDNDIEVAITHSDKSQSKHISHLLTDKIRHREEHTLMLSVKHL